MNQTSRMLIFLFFFLMLASPLWAQNYGPYCGIFVGGQFLAPAKAEDSFGTFNLEYQPAPSGSLVFGWELEPENIAGEGRVELEYTHRSNAFDQAEYLDGKVSGKGDLSADSLLVNTFTVYRTENPLTPYFGAGIGVARVAASDLTVTGQPLSDDDAVVFAYQLGAGVDVALTQSLMLDFGYRFFNTLKVKLKEANGDEFETSYMSHSVMVGLRMAFYE